MALQYTKLADPAYVASSVGSIYANPASTKSYIKSILLYNGNTTTETVTVHMVPDSGGALGTAGVSNRILRRALIADETIEFAPEYPIVLTDENDSIMAVTTTASKVVVVVSGDKDA